MKKILGIILIAALFTGLHSCYSTSIKKPGHLISQDKFVKIMTDMYLVQGINVGINSKKEVLKSLNQTDLYYSVLKKYSVADTVFIRSLIYYSSFPKEYERMHNEIMDKLKETEQKFKPNDKLEVQ